jgi:hypothetical protein
LKLKHETLPSTSQYALSVVPNALIPTVYVCAGT